MKNVLIWMIFACILISSTAQSQTSTKNSKTMNYQTIEKFYIIGISTRTTNENGQSAADLDKLWGRFWGEEIQKQIPNQVNDDVYAVYTDYETDFTGPYTAIIGAAVRSLDNIPEGFVGITIEKTDYQKFISKGKMPEAITNTWMKIWQDEDLNRSYKADFTIHGKKFYDGDNAEVETFISVGE